MRLIPIIDIFAGPGGLGEGFSAFRRNSERLFRIGLSIEKDHWAHQTLELRAYFRQFQGRPPREYYDYLAGRIDRRTLFELHRDEARQAESEAWHAQLGAQGDEKGADPDEVDRRIRTVIGQNSKWVLTGGPPCQAYSVMGRSRILGEDRKKKTDDYSTDHRHRLYREYLRILAVHAPPVFIMENVKGILSSQVNGNRTFLRILDDLQKPLKVSYGSHSADLEYKIFSLAVGKCLPKNIQEYVVRSEDFGVPQRRHRVILLGVRGDISTTPRRITLSQPHSVENAIGQLPSLRSGLSRARDSDDAWVAAVKSAGSASWIKTIAVDVAEEIMRVIGSVKSPEAGRGGRYIEADGHSLAPSFEEKWFVDHHLRGCCNHETRGHISSDLHRYLFASCFAKVRRSSPKIKDFPKALYPKHRNVHAVKPADIIFDDRFRVDLRSEPAATVVSHMAKDGHYFIHYDPLQCRSLTVREAARLQTFPDNYFFEGARTQQYTQVGNAVPPLLARQIAEIVAEVLTSG